MTHSASALELIQSVEQADSSPRLVVAVQNLAEARLKEGIPTLIAVLGYNNPEAAGIAVTGLVQLGEAAVPSLLEQIDDYNYGARAYSFRALAAIADPRALDVLLNAAETDFAPSVRRAVAKGLGHLRWCQLPVEERQEAQERALKTLLLLFKDPEWAIRYAAIVGLQALATSHLVTQPQLVLQILTLFNQIAQADPDLAVRARVWMAQQQLEAPSVEHREISY
ncbi:MAG: HEAT repeat domain-containing protein [Chamaesiphon sp.]